MKILGIKNVVIKFVSLKYSQKHFRNSMNISKESRGFRDHLHTISYIKVFQMELQLWSHN